MELECSVLRVFVVRLARASRLIHHFHHHGSGLKPLWQIIGTRAGRRPFAGPGLALSLLHNKWISAPPPEDMERRKSRKELEPEPFVSSYHFLKQGAVQCPPG